MSQTGTCGHCKHEHQIGVYGRLVCQDADGRCLCTPGFAEKVSSGDKTPVLTPVAPKDFPVMPGASIEIRLDDHTYLPSPESDPVMASERQRWVPARVDWIGVNSFRWSRAVYLVNDELMTGDFSGEYIYGDENIFWRKPTTPLKTGNS